MCGVPYHSAKNYIETLVSKGYKVAICEQTEDPKQAKGVVKREVVQLITPGTITEGKTIDSKTNHFLACAERMNENELAFAYLMFPLGRPMHKLSKAARKNASSSCKAWQSEKSLLQRDFSLKWLSLRQPQVSSYH